MIRQIVYISVTLDFLDQILLYSNFKLKLHK